MATTTHPNQNQAPMGQEVDPAGLVCSGCADVVSCEPPVGWPTSAGATPSFSHRDGSVLCPDSRGRVGEPIEAATVPA